MTWKNVYNELISKGKFILTLVILNIFFDAHSYFKGQDDFDKNTVLISKQLEYSEDNLYYMYNAVMEEEEFSFENLINNIPQTVEKVGLPQGIIKKDYFINKNCN